MNAKTETKHISRTRCKKSSPHWQMAAGEVKNPEKTPIAKQKSLTKRQTLLALVFGRPKEGKKNKFDTEGLNAFHVVVAVDPWVSGCETNNQNKTKSGTLPKGAECADRQTPSAVWCPKGTLTASPTGMRSTTPSAPMDAPRSIGLNAWLCSLLLFVARFAVLWSIQCLFSF